MSQAPHVFNGPLDLLGEEALDFYEDGLDGLPLYVPSLYDTHRAAEEDGTIKVWVTTSPSVELRRDPNGGQSWSVAGKVYAKEVTLRDLSTGRSSGGATGLRAGRPEAIPGASSTPSPLMDPGNGRPAKSKSPSPRPKLSPCSFGGAGSTFIHCSKSRISAILVLMQDSSRYAVGIDIGSTTIRCVVGHIDPVTGTPTIVGVGTAKNSGMRKGIVANLDGPAAAIDEALGEAERMSGYQVNGATLSINGSHILSTKSDGMIAVGTADHEINREDLARIEEVATIGKVPANREILEIVPHSYRLDGQDNIKNPLGMTGTRLEINANVVSALVPHLDNLTKAAEKANVAAHATIPAVTAGARAVLSESQLENGVAVIDLGGATTGVAIYEEGDLQYVAVLPVGGVNITNDLAIGLKTDPEIAERVKIEHGSAAAGVSGPVNVKIDKESYEFDGSEIHEIIEARLEEIFEQVNKELKKAGRAGKLPSGAVLIGGGAQLKGIVDYAKQALGLAVRVGKPGGYGGAADNVDGPDFAGAIGLMLIDNDSAKLQGPARGSGARAGKAQAKAAAGWLSGLFAKFRE